MDGLIPAKGYRMPPAMMYVRLVHLLDPEQRQELMIIYGEDVAPTRFNAADLRKGGNEYNKCPAIESGLIDRAKSSISITE